MPSTTPNSYDFDDLLQSMIVFMKSQTEFKDYNFDGSGIREIMRLLAYDSEQRALQNQFAITELNLDSAQLRANVVSQAANLGYFSKGRKAANIVVDIIVTPKDSPANGSVLLLDKMVRFFANRDGGAIYFTPDQEYSATLGLDGLYTFEGVRLMQGTWSYISYLSSADDAVEAFVIPDKNVDVDTLTVQVRETDTSSDYNTFTKFKSAYDLGSTKNVFFVKENRDGLFEIEFGDGKVGSKLSFGNVILVEYLTTDGENGNDIKALTPATGIDRYFDIKINTNDGLSYGGVAPEDVNIIKKAAPLAFAAQGNAVTDGDYASVTRELFPDARSVIAWGGENNIPPKMGYTFVAVSLATGQALTPQEKADIKNQLERYNVGSIDVIVIDPEYIYVVVDTVVQFIPSQTILSIVSFTSKVNDYIKRYSTSKLEVFGAYFNKSQLISFINSIDKAVTGNKTIVKYEKRFVPTLNFLGTYSFEFQRTLMSGSLMIENFIVSDTDFDNYVYYINDQDGVLKLRKTNTVTGNIIDLRDIGVVDYVTGKIDLIGFTPISIKNGYVRLRVRPVGDESLQSFGNNILTIQEVNTSLEVTQ